MSKSISLEEKKFKAKILKAINEPLNSDMDETDCREWMSTLAEAKRYILNKIKICNKRTNELQLEAEILEATVAESVRSSGVGTATERKAIIDSKFTLHKDYKRIYSEMHRYEELIEGYQADLENLTEKSFAVRKIADFERVHLMYMDGDE